MNEVDPIWLNVPDPQPEVEFIVDEPKENEFTVICDREIAGYEVTDVMYLINGVWRIGIEDQDDTENPGVSLIVTVDRRYKVEDVRQAVRKLLENLYSMETE
jgi:hypothetical protein